MKRLRSARRRKFMLRCVLSHVYRSHAWSFGARILELESPQSVRSKRVITVKSPLGVLRTFARRSRKVVVVVSRILSRQCAAPNSLRETGRCAGRGFSLISL